MRLRYWYSSCAGLGGVLVGLGFEVPLENVAGGLVCGDGSEWEMTDSGVILWIVKLSGVFLSDVRRNQLLVSGSRTRPQKRDCVTGFSG
jgi:hypothetical protein